MCFIILGKNDIQINHRDERHFAILGMKLNHDLKIKQSEPVLLGDTFRFITTFKANNA